MSDLISHMRRSVEECQAKLDGSRCDRYELLRIEMTLLTTVDDLKDFYKAGSGYRLSYQSPGALGRDIHALATITACLHERRHACTLAQLQDRLSAAFTMAEKLLAALSQLTSVGYVPARAGPSAHASG